MDTVPPPPVISYSIWAYYRFSLSFRDVEDLLAERGIEVSYESIRRWCLKFEYAVNAEGFTGFGAAGGRACLRIRAHRARIIASIGIRTAPAIRAM